MSDFRIESDSMGEMNVPAQALYGAQTQRARLNFPISSRRMPRPFIAALAMVKQAAAEVNAGLGLLADEKANAIIEAAKEVREGTFDPEFVVDVFQTGSGTSTNMNANEVIAHRACQILGQEATSRAIHPNDDVNMGQSSNDTIPTAMYVAAHVQVTGKLLPALEKLEAAFSQKARELDDVVKIGRTHLQDATPIRLGQEMSGYASQVRHGRKRLTEALTGVSELAIGGTAVGTGINTHPEFGGRVAARLSELTGISFREAENHFEAQAAKDAAVQLSGTLKTLAVSLMKIAVDIRWLASGPRCGIGELRIPETQPGSSIMPGKVNPVIAESVMMVSAEVQAHDLAITLCGQHGNFELNVMMPLMAYDLLESIELVANAAANFSDRCIEGLEADKVRCEGLIEQSLAMCTALAPHIGYDAAAKIAKKAYAEDKTVREVALEEGVLAPDELSRLLDPRSQTEPGRR